MAELKKGNRSNARSAAEGAASNVEQGAGSGEPRRPADPKPSDNTTETANGGAEAAAPAPAADIPLVVIAPNPKRVGSKAFGFYQKYGSVGVMTTHREALDRGVRGKDVSWDRDRRHILLKDDAKNFPTELPDGFELAEGQTEEQALRALRADYLRGLMAKDSWDGMNEGQIKDAIEKRLIAWGWVDAPPKEVEAAKTEVAQTEAEQVSEPAAA